MQQAAHDPIVIVGMARTPIGGFHGVFASLAAPQLGSAGGHAAPGTIPAAESPPAPWPAEIRDPEESRGSDQAAGGRPDRA